MRIFFLESVWETDLIVTQAEKAIALKQTLVISTDVSNSRWQNYVIVILTSACYVKLNVHLDYSGSRFQSSVSDDYWYHRNIMKN